MAHERLTPGNCDRMLFDDVLWVANAKRDHFDFMNKMREREVEVVEFHQLLEETVKILWRENGFWIYKWYLMKSP